MKAGLNKGNVLIVITSDDHAIIIEKEKSLPTWDHERSKRNQQ
jgi:bifunctional DNA-binding transcriptional regulator/antitoxin component of YhaV-PrlF toxin-antitoxin module